jgi:hypothetical protein
VRLSTRMLRLSAVLVNAEYAVKFWTALMHKDSPQRIIDHQCSTLCPHCNANTNLSAISTPRWEQMVRYKPQKVIVGYRCDACGEPVALKFASAGHYHNRNANEDLVELSIEFEELERPMQTFDYQHLPNDVASDFRETLTCFSHQCWNAAAAMCRRTVQSIATNLGANGTDRVKRQILEIKDAAGIDDDTYDGLKQIIVDGHDGSHPHLPAVNEERATTLVMVMKDVLYQIYIRKAQIQQAMALRNNAIAGKSAQ